MSSLLLCVGAALVGPLVGQAVADVPGVSAVKFDPSTKLPTADRVVVRKGARRMDLLSGDRVLRSYRIALGLSPTGHKERSGDFRTPEGTYRLARRNARSEFFLSIQVSYPNEADLANARRNGWQAGGSIMIHGLPNTLKHDPNYYRTRDWTDGCIAVSNSEMVEIWMLTNSNTPIDILP
ncbi:MAG: L,D-transpeptidase family protein [Steroidobacteraceae bacterium]